MGTKQFDSATDLITFTRASSSTFLGSNGLIQTATNNTPRIEYNADGTVKGLLIEEARTNLLTYSEDFSNSGWAKDNLTVGTGVTSPDGTTVSDRLTANTNGFTHLYPSTRSSTTGVTYSTSVFAKANTHNIVQLNAPSTSSIFVNFNLTTGVKGTENNCTASIQSVGDGWYKCSITWVSASTLNSFGFSIVDNITSGRTTATTAGYSVDVYGAQAEAGAFPTSYIPTVSSTATRARDFAQILTSAFGYNNDKGSLVIDVLTPDADQFTGLAVFNTVNYHNSRGLWKGNNALNGAGDYFFFQTFDGVVTKFLLGQQTQAEHTKLGLSYGDNENAVKDGGTVISGTRRYPNPIRLILGGRDDGVQSQCWIKSIKYYPRRLTNVQLQELTT